MKNIFLPILIGFSLQTGFSQTATNFTVNDCASVNHDLFTELDAGKVIVLDWVMPCGSCIGPSISAYNIAQSYQGTYPGRVVFYMADDYANTSCSTLNGWASANSMPNSTKFSNAAISMSDYGTDGMPKIIVLGGASHTVFYNSNNSINTTAFTAAIDAALAATAIKEEENSFLSINLFPNPADNKTNISYSLESSSDVKVDIYNIVGEKASSVFYGKQIAGEHKLNIDSSKLGNGIYFIKLIAGSAEKTIKLSVSH